MKKNLIYLFFSFFVFACSTQKRITGEPFRELTFLGEYFLPHKMQFNGTTVGGLSSIDYIPSEDIYYMVCDDRSDHNPARFYTAKIILNEKGIDSVQLLQSTALLQKNGQPYPNRKQDPENVPDPEAMRLNFETRELVWSSEGERVVRKEATVLADPSINIIGVDGRLTDTFPLPGNMRMNAAENGPRQNAGFEGLAFTPDFETLFVSVEEPLYEDGSRARLDTAGWIRIIQYDVNTKMPTAQFAYQIDPVVQEPISSGLFIVNGVSDILAINDHQLLVTERSFSTGRLGCNVRVYLVELNGAENVAALPSLSKIPAHKQVHKKLVLDMDKLERLINNVEGATFGPVLPNGNRSLIFVSDDNFSSRDKTQFLLFEVE